MTDEIRIPNSEFPIHPPPITSSPIWMGTPPPKADPAARPDDALLATGRKLAQAHRCAACHKADFSGTQATARLAAQREDCLLKALRDFKSGARTGGGMAAMADVVYPLADGDLPALAHLLAHWPS